MQNAKILWADDEIDLLKAHILFLKAKGFEVESVTNGADAVDAIKSNTFDIVFLDENMPGMGGLEALAEIKTISPQTPVVMITKSEEEFIMEEAIGGKISDYLIKPVNPNQILLACKKILQNRELVSQKIQSGYQQDFRRIGMQFYDDIDHQDWVDIYKKLTHWDMEMEQNEDKTMVEILSNQRTEANTNFSKFVMDNYLHWINSKDSSDRPLLSMDVLPETALKSLDDNYESVFFILIDCLRYDQWREFRSLIAQYFYINSEECYYSILPTATQYARNSIFAGISPLEISRKFPKYWKNDEEEGGKNLYESNFLEEMLIRKRLNIKHSYNKVIKNEQGASLVENYKNLLKNDLNVIVYNFIDALSHSRTDVDIIRELAPTEAAYRSVSRSWLEFSPLMDLLKRLNDHNVKVILTTDHGTVRVQKPVKIIGDRNTSTNTRYKTGRNLSYDERAKYLFTISRPEEAMLPKTNVSSSYVFTTEDYFFAYPNNYNYYVNYFKDTFQHGGISMEEMIVPIIDLSAKR
ncbi:MAG: PglZ domain-containing protein [Bacteroidia bacterium]|nr:PglZ domain-containing protein [Bacteroidia bacterium]